MSEIRAFINKIYRQIRNWFSGLPRYARHSIIALVTFLVLFLIIDLIFPVHTNIRYSKLILSDEKKLLNASLSFDQQWRMKTGIEEVNPLLIKTMIYKEDSSLKKNTNL